MKNEVTMTKTDKYLLWGMVAGLSLLLILRDVNGISINKFIYFGFAVALMAIASYRTVVYMVCFLLPLVCGLPGTYIMLCAWMLLVIKKGRIKVMQLVPVLLILLLELFAALWYPSVDFALIVNYVSFAAVMIFLIHDNSAVNYDRCVALYLLGSVLLCYVILAATFVDAPKNWIKLFAEGQFRIGDQHIETGAMTLKLNANSLAYYSLTGMACGVLLAEKAIGVKKVGYVLVAIFFIAIGFLTLSRSWLLVTAICLTVYIISKLRRPKHFITLLLVILAIVALAAFVFDRNPELLAGFETRFNDDTVESGGSRLVIFKRYMQTYVSNIRFILFGTGVTQYQPVAEMAGSIHNGTQQILVCCGLFGFFLYMAVLISPILKARRSHKISAVYWLPLISIVMFAQTIQFLNPMMLMLPYIIGIYTLRMGAEDGVSGVKDVTFS